MFLVDFIVDFIFYASIAVLTILVISASLFVVVCVLMAWVYALLKLTIFLVF